MRSAPVGRQRRRRNRLRPCRSRRDPSRPGRSGRPGDERGRLGPATWSRRGGTRVDEGDSPSPEAGSPHRWRPPGRSLLQGRPGWRVPDRRGRKDPDRPAIECLNLPEIPCLRSACAMASRSKSKRWTSPHSVANCRRSRSLQFPAPRTATLPCRRCSAPSRSIIRFRCCLKKSQFSRVLRLTTRCGWLARRSSAPSRLTTISSNAWFLCLPLGVWNSTP